jgi:hypothetical protein
MQEPGFLQILRQKPVPGKMAVSKGSYNLIIRSLIEVCEASNGP